MHWFAARSRVFLHYVDSNGSTAGNMRTFRPGMDLELKTLLALMIAGVAAAFSGANAEGRSTETERQSITDADPVIVSSSSDATPEGDADWPPVAENVDLSEPFELNEHSVSDVSAPESEGGIEPVATEPASDETEAAIINEPIVLLGTTVPIATSARLSWSPHQSFEGIAAPTPVLVVNGTRPGPTVCLTAAVHGDELNGIEIVRSVLYDLSPDKLSGTVIGVPIVNLQGFRRSSRYLPDRRDLNRYFPGNSTGSSASRIAHSFFREVISHCDAPVSYTHLTLPTIRRGCRSRWSPYH